MAQIGMDGKMYFLSTGSRATWGTADGDGINQGAGAGSGASGGAGQAQRPAAKSRWLVLSFVPNAIFKRRRLAIRDRRLDG